MASIVRNNYIYFALSCAAQVLCVIPEVQTAEIIDPELDGGYRAKHLLLLRDALTAEKIDPELDGEYCATRLLLLRAVLRCSGPVRATCGADRWDDLS